MVLDEAAVHRIREARKGLIAKVASGAQGWKFMSFSHCQESGQQVSHSPELAAKE